MSDVKMTQERELASYLHYLARRECRPSGDKDAAKRLDDCAAHLEQQMEKEA